MAKSFSRSQPIAVGDHIAYASDPTSLLGRVTKLQSGGRIEYMRMGQAAYADAGSVVHQACIQHRLQEVPDA